MRSKLLFLVPAIHLALIGVLLFFHFGYGESFTHSVGALQFRGATRYTTLDPSVEPHVSRAKITFRGLIFHLSNSMPLTLLSDESVEEELTPLRYEQREFGFALQFSYGIAIGFSVSTARPTDLTITLETPQEENFSDAHIKIPFQLDRNAIWIRQDNLRKFYIKYRNTEFALALPPGAAIDSEKRHLILRLDTPQNTIQYILQRSGISDEVMAFLVQQQDNAILDHAEYTAYINSYISNGYIGWKGARFNRADGVWNLRDGGEEFKELTAVALLSEALKRREYNSVINSVRRAADRNFEKLSYLSVPFLGNALLIWPQFVQQDRELEENILEKIEKRDLDLLTIPDLFHFIFYRGSQDTYRKLIAFTEEIDVSTLTIAQGIGLLQNMHTHPLPTSETQQLWTNFRTVIDDIILPELVILDAKSTISEISLPGIFLNTGRYRIDMASTVAIGSLFIRLGMEEENDELRHIGQLLVLSVLELADDDGYVPQVLFTNNRGIQSFSGFIGPENLYAFIHDNPYYPHWVLIDHIDADSSALPTQWIWTAMPITASLHDGRVYNITLENIPNIQNFIIVNNVPQPTAITLFQRPLTLDRNFEEFIRGAYYDAETNALIIKYTEENNEGTLQFR